MKKQFKAIVAAVLAAATFATTSIPAFADKLSKDSNGVVSVYSDNNVYKSKYTGFATENGNRYYYKNGYAVKGRWFKVNGEYYYAYSDGSLATGAANIGNDIYFFDASGKEITEEAYLTNFWSNYYYGCKLTAIKKDLVSKYNIDESSVLFYTEKGKSLNNVWNVPSCYDATSIVVDSYGQVKIYGKKQFRVPDAVMEVVAQTASDAIKQIPDKLAEKFTEKIVNYFSDKLASLSR